MRKSLILGIALCASIATPALADSGTTVSLDSKSSYLLLGPGVKIADYVVSGDITTTWGKGWFIDGWAITSPEVDATGGWSGPCGAFICNASVSFFDIPSLGKTLGDIVDFKAGVEQDAHPLKLESSIGWYVHLEEQVHLGGSDVHLLRPGIPFNIVLGDNWSVSGAVEYSQHLETAKSNVNWQVGVYKELGDQWTVGITGEGFHVFNSTDPDASDIGFHIAKHL